MKKTDSFTFRLYVTGNAPNSLRAVANLDNFCREHLPERHSVEVVDLVRHPQRALADGIYVTPTLVKLAPGPELRFVGSLNDIAPVLAGLGLRSN